MLVEPPIATTPVTAFSKAFRVRISDGRMFFSRRFITACPASREDAALRWPTFGYEAEPGSERPSASPMDDMVLAVNMPPHEPEPGQAWFSIATSSSAPKGRGRCSLRASAFTLSSVSPCVRQAFQVTRSFVMVRRPSFDYGTEKSSCINARRASSVPDIANVMETKNKGAGPRSLKILMPHYGLRAQTQRTGNAYRAIGCSKTPMSQKGNIYIYIYIWVFLLYILSLIHIVTCRLI